MMQSHLTRRVFRAIVNNEPLQFSRCRNRLLHTAPVHRARSIGVLNPPHIQRRGFFAFNISQPSEDQSATLRSEIGLKPMRDLMKAKSHRNRPPANSVLTKAFQNFFVARSDAPGVITGFHARLLVQTWRHLNAQQDELESEDWQAVFSTENLENVLFVLSEATCLSDSHGEVQNLARYAFNELCTDNGFGSNAISRPAIIAYINIQSLNGNPEEGRHIADKFWNRLRQTKPSPLLPVMKGFALKGDRFRLKRTAEEWVKQGKNFDSSSHEELATMLIELDLLDSVKTIYECPISDSPEPSIATKKAVIRYAILKSEIAWAKPIFESLPQTSLLETLDTRLLWEAANGKRASDISEQVQLWMAEDPEIEELLTISCVNNLIEFANAVNDPALTVEFAELASSWELQPDSKTLVLQLESRVQTRDLHGTLEFLRNLPDVTPVVFENLPLTNKLITMLCLSEQNDPVFDQISLLLDPIFETGLRLEADTIAALTHMLLYRHDWEAVSELLRPRLGTYQDEERSKIRKAMNSFIMDSNQDTNYVWETYELLRIAFPETGVAMRTEIMTAFFKRERNDLACQVFGHMRQAEDFAQRPKPNTYARCFQGIARTGDPQNLELVHNMLKLDVEVELNTRVLNGLMLAYASCEMAEKSMEVFRDILQTEEGPSQETIGIFFKVCEKHHNGAQEAMKMMKKVKVLEITVDRKLYMGYIEALAAQCEFDMAAEAINNMEREIGCAPSQRTIGLFYNAIPYQYWKDEVEKWAKVNYPEQWARLETKHRTDTEEGFKFDNMDYEILV